MAMGDGYSPPRTAQAEYSELRLADNWGNPSEIVASTVRWARMADGSELQPCEEDTFLSRVGKLKIYTKHPSHALCWKVQEFD